MKKKISLREVILEARIIFKENFRPLIWFTSIALMITIALTCLLLFISVKYLHAEILSKHWMSGAVFFGVVLSVPLTVSLYQISLKLIDGRGQPNSSDFLPSWMKMLNVTGFLIVQFLINTVIKAPGYIYSYLNSSKINTSTLLIAVITTPILLYISIRMGFAFCFIVDQDSGPIKAIKQSWAITKGHFWFVFCLVLLISGVNILGAIAFLGGLVFTIPFSVLITLIAYRKMINTDTDDEHILLENPDTLIH